MSPSRQVFARFVGDAVAVEIDVALRNDGQVVINIAHLESLLLISTMALHYLEGACSREDLAAAVEGMVPVVANRVGPFTNIAEYLKRAKI